MNKRARARLIGVTAIILVAVGAILAGTMSKTGAYEKTVAEIVEDPSLVGQRVRVSGVVIQGSWNKRSNPMLFEIGDENVDGGPTLKVVYNGQVPGTFGDKVTAIITGELKSDGTIESTNMTTKCPSKYQSGVDALTVASLLATKAKMTGVPTKIIGYVSGAVAPPGMRPRLAVADKPDGAGLLTVAYDGAIPTTVTEGKAVIITGELGEDGIFTATDVALAKES